MVCRWTTVNCCYADTTSIRLSSIFYFGLFDARADVTLRGLTPWRLSDRAIPCGIPIATPTHWPYDRNHYTDLGHTTYHHACVQLFWRHSHEPIPTRRLRGCRQSWVCSGDGDMVSI